MFVNLCQPLFATAKVDCTASKKCTTAGEACLPAILAGGPDTTAKVDGYHCQRIVNSKDPVPTKKVGELCNPDPQAGPATCVSGLCWEDLKPGTGYCSALCSSDLQCGAGTVCDLKHQWLPRKDATKAAIVPVCLKKKACLPCSTDSQCHSALRCTNVPGTGPACAYPCNSNADCTYPDGGGTTCEPAIDRWGAPIPGVCVVSPQAVLVNSGNANCATGEQGLKLARWSCQEAGAQLGIAPGLVLPCSTGVIGVQLDRRVMGRAIELGVEGLSRKGFGAAARATNEMLTCDCCA